MPFHMFIDSVSNSYKTSYESTFNKNQNDLISALRRIKDKALIISNNNNNNKENIDNSQKSSSRVVV